ncbi:hypothetical protein H1R20_g10497, partial [Candolleomyces eurysporus]
MNLNKLAILPDSRDLTGGESNSTSNTLQRACRQWQPRHNFEIFQTLFATCSSAPSSGSINHDELQELRNCLAQLEAMQGSGQRSAGGKAHRGAPKPRANDSSKIAVHFPELFDQGLFLRNWPLHELAMSVFNNKRKEFNQRQKGRRKKRSKKSQGKQKARDDPSLSDEEPEADGTPPPGLIGPSGGNDFDGEEDKAGSEESIGCTHGKEDGVGSDDEETNCEGGIEGDNGIDIDDAGIVGSDGDDGETLGDAIQQFEQMKASFLSRFPQLRSQLAPNSPAQDGLKCKAVPSPSNASSTSNKRPRKSVIVLSSDDA